MVLKSKSRFTYANVASTLALVIAIGGGGAATAASVMLARNSVGSPQIVNGGVHTPDLGASSVKSAKIANGSVTANKFGANMVGVVRGYAWIGASATPIGSPVTLNNGYIFNSTGGAVKLTHTAVGQYTVLFTGVTLYPGNVQVNAYGGANSSSCHVRGWSASGSVGVDCHDTAGALVNSRFTIAVIR